MKKLIKSIVTVVALALLPAAMRAATLIPSGNTSASVPGKFEAADGKFLLNGDSIVIKAAELHYPRIPRPYWDQRIKLCKALGMNTVCLYTFWNAHEPHPDQFDFTGQNDLREFVKLCQANGMNVILRPGPYVCAEWEMGGLPGGCSKRRISAFARTTPISSRESINSSRPWAHR